MLFVVALMLSLAAPLLGLMGATEPVAILERRTGNTPGLIHFFAGLAGTFVTQVARAPHEA